MIYSNIVSFQYQARTCTDISNIMHCKCILFHNKYDAKVKSVSYLGLILGPWMFWIDPVHENEY